MWRINRGGWPAVGSLDDLKSVLFLQRGINNENIPYFFEADYERDIHNPYLLHGMNEAVDRIYRAVKRGERIIVYGDYDADGITATAILLTVLRDMGANAVPFLPHRFNDGYGVSAEILKKIEPEIDLLITVDCGVSNTKELAWLKKKGKDSIVVDHHELPDDLPPSIAVLHPRHPEGNYPFAYLSGAGMSWKLCQAIAADERFLLYEDKDYIKWLMDLALMGTVGDMVVLLGENRAITRFGLEVMKRTRRPGLKALMAKSRLFGEDINVENISWRLVSKINAAGRMDHPQPALELLITRDEKKAQELVAVLEQYNRERQGVTKKILEEAKLQINREYPIIFASNIKWSAGVVGLAAGRLAEEFGKPAIVVGGNGKNAVGSARSPVGTDILRILKNHEELMLKLGGHTQAAGFSIDSDKLEDLRRAVCECALDHKIADKNKIHAADAVLNSSLINKKTLELIRSFEPFGEGNKKPVFISQNLELIDTRIVGKTKEHVKFTWHVDGDNVVEGIGFGLAKKAVQLKKKTDVMFHLEENEWMGRRNLQLNVKDLEAAKSTNIIKE